MHSIICDRQGQKWILKLLEDGEVVDQHSTMNHMKAGNLVSDWCKKHNIEKECVQDPGGLFAHMTENINPAELEAKNSPLGGEKKTPKMKEAKVESHVPVKDSVEPEKHEKEKHVEKHVEPEKHVTEKHAPEKHEDKTKHKK